MSYSVKSIRNKLWKQLILTLIVCLILTILDVIIVEGYYRLNQAWDDIHIWHILFTTSWLTISILLTFLMKSVIPLLIWVYFLFGIEDSIFYLIGYGAIPEKYWGVAILGIYEPTKQMVLGLNSIGIIIIALIILIYKKLSELSLSYERTK